MGGVLGPCPCAIWSSWLVAVYKYHLDAGSRSLEHVFAQASYRLVAVLRRGSAGGHERSSLGGVYLSERSLLGSFRKGIVFGPVRRLRTGGPAPVGNGVSMACSPALGLSPRP